MVEKPTTYTFEPGEVVVQKGGSTLNFNYKPSANAQADATTVAFEYVFGNTMDRATAVNLKEIDTTDVNVSYTWSSSRIDFSTTVTTYTNYELQKLINNGDKVYIYVVVTPINESIPVTFTNSIVWYYGIPYEMPIVNNVTGEIEYQTIVDGQKIDKNTLTIPTAPAGCYFDGWYLDAKFGTRVDSNEVRTDKKLYARFANLPNDWLMWEKDHYLVTKYRYDNTTAPTSTLPSNLVIPAIYNDGTHGEAPVTHIYNYGSPNSGVFECQDNITKVTIPNTLTNIGWQAFISCGYLSELVFDANSSLRVIADGAFHGTDLINVTIPASVTHILGSAFFVYGLESVIFEPNSQLTNIGGATTFVVGLLDLSNCDNLTSITVADCIDADTLILPSSVTTLGADTLDVTNLVFEDNSQMTSFNDHFNSYEYRLQSIDFGNNSKLTSIDQTYFNNSKNLTHIDFGDNSQLTTIEADTFATNTKLQSVDFGNNSKITNIPKNAFKGITTLSNINFGQGSLLSRIFDSAFYGCTALTNIIIPASVNYIHGSAFNGCTALQSVAFEANSQLIQIYSNAFAHCENLQTINLQACTKLNRIDSDTFHWCYKLQSIIIPDSVTYMGSSIFRECRELTTVTIPENVANIGRYCFEGCTKLTEIVFEDAEGWYELLVKADWLEFTGGTSIDLSNSQHNVIILTELAPDNTDASKYSNKYLYKK